MTLLFTTPRLSLPRLAAGGGAWPWRRAH